MLGRNVICITTLLVESSPCVVSTTKLKIVHNIWENSILTTILKVVYGEMHPKTMECCGRV